MLKYYGPNGENVEEPTINFIENILKKDSSYWASGSGDSSLFFDDETSRLIFFQNENLGFFIMQHPDYIAPYNPEIEIEKVFHNVGGEPMSVPTCCFVNIVDAREIFIEFMANGKISNISNWKDIYELIDYEE